MPFYGSYCYFLCNDNNKEEEKLFFCWVTGSSTQFNHFSPGLSRSIITYRKLKKAYILNRSMRVYMLLSMQGKQ